MKELFVTRYKTTNHIQKPSKLIDTHSPLIKVIVLGRHNSEDTAEEEEGMGTRFKKCCKVVLSKFLLAQPERTHTCTVSKGDYRTD